MYSKNVFDIVDMIRGYNFEITHSNIFPIWYSNPSVDYVSNGGTFYLIDKKDCDVVIDRQPPYVLPLKSKVQGWW